jgi:single-strand DNA-binding protein
MINATAIGRLGRRSDNRQVGQHSVLSFSVACDHGWGANRTTTWVSVSVWGKRGEALARVLEKGSQVAVRGELFERVYTGKDGQERRSWDMRADDVKMIGSRPSAGHNDRRYGDEDRGTGDNAYDSAVPF